jgi:hypothetical protein
VPFIAWRYPVGSMLGLSYVMKEGTSTVVIGPPPVTLARERELTSTVNDDPVPHQAYRRTVIVEDKHGQSETHVIALTPPSA